MDEPLAARRSLLSTKVLPKLRETGGPPRSPRRPLPGLVESAKAQGFEGLVAKRANRGQEFVIGGYTVGGNPFDALIFGYYEGDRLLYAGRTRSGFTAAARGAVQAVQGT